MTDTLWNGIIGAGGAAICCAVYFGFKAVRKGISKIQIKRNKVANKMDSTVDSQQHTQIDEPTTEHPTKITITIPTKKQVFTRSNIRAFGFIVIAIVCFGFADTVDNLYHPTGSGDWASFEGDYYTYATQNLYDIVKNTRAIYDTMKTCFSYLFVIMGMAFAIIGLTNFKFK